VSSFFQHMLGYSVPYHGVPDLHKKCGYNQGYLATMKINNKYIVQSKRVGNENKNMTTENKNVKLGSRLFSYNEI